MKKPFRSITIVTMTIEEYRDKYANEYDDGNLFDYPLNELDHVLEDTDIEKLAFIDKRLYEMN